MNTIKGYEVLELYAAIIQRGLSQQAFFSLEENGNIFEYGLSGVIFRRFGGRA